MATWRYVCIEILKGPKYPHCFKIFTLSGQLFGYFRKAAQCLWLEVWNWIPLMLADYTLLFRLLKWFVLLHSHRLSDNAICRLLRLGQAGVLMPPVQSVWLPSIKLATGGNHDSGRVKWWCSRMFFQYLQTVVSKSHVLMPIFDIIYF